jgi:diaminopimelate decarboxylase
VSAERDWLLGLDTPSYVFDPHAVCAQHAALRAQLGTRLIVSLKANSHPDLFVRCGHAFTDGVELATIGELDIVVGRGKLPRYLNNPAMDDELMRAGIASRCHFVLDNPDAAARFAPLAGGQPVGSVTLRINAAALAGSAARKDQHDHFGMTPAEAFTVARALAATAIRVTGLHVFAGSYTFRVEAAELALGLGRLADELAAAAGGPLTFLNLGGGFSDKGHAPEVFERYRARIAPLAARYELAHESGRAVFAGAGMFVTKVVAVKRWRDQTIAVCDGGMSHNFLLARTEQVIKAWQAPRIVRAQPAAHTAPAGVVNFVGSTCSRADQIGQLRDAAPPAVGDRVVFEHCGAYNRTYTVGGFLSHKPAHVYIRQA